jgi:hypothetical protein
VHQPVEDVPQGTRLRVQCQRCLRTAVGRPGPGLGDRPRERRAGAARTRRRLRVRLEGGKHAPSTHVSPARPPGSRLSTRQVALSVVPPPRRLCSGA